MKDRKKRDDPIQRAERHNAKRAAAAFARPFLLLFVPREQLGTFSADES